ncbi:MAG TPA: hypothetical protein VGU74_15050 [Gemmatimonadales bacterium]|nr:hypothetical protein [Gemmatimonadales bacterium]
MADLKPMDLGELLDGALTIFRRHFLLFMKIGVIALWFPVALAIYVELAGGSEQHPVLGFFIVVIRWFAGVFLTASAIRVISDSYLGRRPELADAIALGSSKIMPLFLVGLGKGLLLGLIGIGAVMVGALTIPALIAGGGGGGLGVFAVFALVIAGFWLMIYVACGYAVTTPVVVLEDLNSSSDSFGRSWDLTRGFKLKIFLISLVSIVVVFIPGIAIALLGEYLTRESPIVGQSIEILSAALPILLTPLFSCVLTLLYYDLRVRREAFDLEVLSEQLGALR